MIGKLIKVKDYLKYFFLNIYFYVFYIFYYFNLIISHNNMTDAHQHLRYVSIYRLHIKRESTAFAVLSLI